MARRLLYLAATLIGDPPTPLPSVGLSVRDVAVSFGGITALEGVSVDVSPGEVLGVIGPNGAGKTTLFNVICGFVSPDSGTLRWRGDSMTRVHPDRLASLGIARTLQGVGLFTGLTVLENVMAGARAVPPHAAAERDARPAVVGPRRAPAARPRPVRAVSPRLRGCRRSPARHAALRRPEARGAGAGARLRARAPVARRAGRRTRRRRAGRARRADRFAGQLGSP